MKIQKLFALVILTGAVSTAWATGGGYHRCGGGGGTTPPPECTVTWDFHNNGSYVPGDPLTYTGYSNEDPAPDGVPFNLAIRGFTIGRGSSNHGVISDSSAIISVDGNGKGIGVTAAGEGDHWGGKIDNERNRTSYDDSYEHLKVRDAVLLDFDDCLVSLYQVKLEAIHDTDFELWSIGGDEAAALAMAFDPPGGNPDADLSGLLDDYDLWADDADYTFIESNYGGSSTRTATISEHDKARFFVLISGADQTHSYDAFRMKKLVANCVGADCGGGGITGVPIPGTLALLGIGALLGRKRFLKQA